MQYVIFLTFFARDKKSVLHGNQNRFDQKIWQILSHIELAKSPFFLEYEVTNPDSDAKFLAELFQ